MKPNNSNIDAIISYMFIRKLATPIIKTDAYKLGIVGSNGKKIRELQTEADKNAFTILDQLIFKLKRLLGSKIAVFNSFLWTTVGNNNISNKIIANGSIEQRVEIQRIRNQLTAITEKFQIEDKDLVTILLEKEVGE